LQQSCEIGCESTEMAQEAVQLLRKLNCWWGRASPPALVVYVNPVSGSGRFVLFSLEKVIFLRLRRDIAANDDTLYLWLLAGCRGTQLFWN